MDTLEKYRGIVKKVLTEYANIPHAYGEIKCEPVFDRTNDRYLLMNVGWLNDRRVHSSFVHVDIIDDKLWIQRDGTENGIAKELVKAGIPKDKIVLAFRPPEIRQHTEYAVA
jgi:hypothetical protein